MIGSVGSSREPLNHADVKPLCPEGPRYCGVPVWKLGLDEMKRVL